MKKLFFKTSILAIFIIIFFYISYLIIFKMIPPQFGDTYQSILNTKYKLLIEGTKQKVIYVSGSSGAFCLNSETVSKEINMPFINLGTHAGFGISFNTEISKAGIKSGDIVLLAHEFDLYMSDYDNYDNIGLIATAMNDNFELTSNLNLNQKLEFIKYLPTYAIKKIDKFLGNTSMTQGLYSSNSFDEFGRMISNGKKPVKNSALDERKIEFDKEKIKKDVIKELKEYKEFVESKGASIVLVYPYIYENAVVSKKEFTDYVNTISKKLGIEVLYDIESSLKKRDLFYDTIYHCNGVGQEKYSKFLSKELNDYIKEKI